MFRWLGVLFVGLGSLNAQTVDLIVHGAIVETLDVRYRDVTAVAVRGDRIHRVGTDEEILALAGEGTEVIDARGAFLAPGFIESHGHFARLGESLRSLDLTKCTSYEDMVRLVAEVSSKRPKGTWITGRGWDQNRWPSKSFPSHEALSRASPDHPVYLVRVDGHAALANAAALEIADVTEETTSPPGGEIIRGKNAAPTGVLIDRAMSLVARRLPAQSRELLEGDLLRAQEKCFSEGITSFQDAGTPPSTVRVMSRLAEKDALRIRLWVMLAGGPRAVISRLSKTPPIIGRHDNRLTVRAFKLSIDGALGSRGAALLEDYSDRTGSRGLLMYSGEEMTHVAKLGLERGYQICVHAIGDRANRVVLDAFEKAFEGVPDARNRRFRIEHAQILDRDDIPRFAELGVIASIQGVHCTSDMPWVPTRIGAERTAEGAYAWRDLLDRGTVLCNGTDAPVESVSVIENYFASVTRQRPDGKPEEGWNPARRLTRIEALHSCTLAPAYAAFEDHLKGSIIPGKLADLVLMDTNLLTCTDREILDTRILMTIVGGEIVFRR